MLILGQLGGEVIGGRPAVELLIEAVHRRVRLELGARLSRRWRSPLDGVAQVVRRTRSMASGARTGGALGHGPAGSGSIALRALMAFAIAADRVRRLSRLAELLGGPGGRGRTIRSAARSSRRCCVTWLDSSLVIRRASSNFCRVGSVRRHQSGSSFARRSSACRASFLRSSSTWATGWPNASAARRVLSAASRAACSGDRLRDCGPEGGWIDLASRAIASWRRPSAFRRSARASFSSLLSLSFSRSLGRASLISPLRKHPGGQDQAARPVQT